MHELTLACNLLEQVIGLQKEYNFTQVKEILLSCGSYNCISGESISFHLEAISTGTCLSGATVIVEKILPQYNCQGCKATFTIPTPTSDRSCPTCQGLKTTYIPAQDEVILEKIETD